MVQCSQKMRTVRQTVSTLSSLMSINTAENFLYENVGSLQKLFCRQLLLDQWPHSVFRESGRKCPTVCKGCCQQHINLWKCFIRLKFEHIKCRVFILQTSTTGPTAAHCSCLWRILPMVYLSVENQFSDDSFNTLICFTDKYYWTNGKTLSTGNVEDSVPLFVKDLANNIFILRKCVIRKRFQHINFLGNDYFTDKYYWTDGYTLAAWKVEDSGPLFVKDLANDIFICGKSVIKIWFQHIVW